jgi:hypothetical protein
MLSTRRAAEHSESPPPLAYRLYGIAALLLLAAAILLPASAAQTASLERNASMAAAPGGKAGDGLPEEYFEKIIRAAYDALERYTAHSGARIQFDLANLATYGEDAFDYLRIIDVATMAEGRVIDVGRHRQSTSYPSGEELIEVQYAAKWKTQDAGWRGDPTTVAGLDLPLSQARPLLEDGDPRFRDLRAVTTYDVTVTLGEENRSYRASFFWFKPSGEIGWERFDLLVADHITQGVGAALRETVPVEGGRVPPPDPGAESDGSLRTKAVSCVAGSVLSLGVVRLGSGTNQHIVGSHTAGAALGFDCRCDSSCRQVCEADVSALACNDSGVTIDFSHTMGFDSDASTGVTLGGGATCASGFRCVQKSCPFTLCGLSVSVSVVGSSVSFGGEAGNWAFQRSLTGECPLCEVVTGIDDREPPCGGAVTNTRTVSMDLDSDTGLTSRASTSSSSRRTSRQRQLSPGVGFPLHRVETRDGETFIMDDWAVASDGVVVATSNPAFGRAVAQQRAAPERGPALLVQKPVHVMNARHVFEPAVALEGFELPGPLQGSGEIVAARIEFAPGGRAESVEFLYSSAPIDEEGIGKALKRRVFLGFHGNQEHRAAAYVVVRLSETLQLLSAVSVLPQCCCGVSVGEEPHCV